jgi:isopenicillin N synthase-like dioxygenase
VYVLQMEETAFKYGGQPHVCVADGGDCLQIASLSNLRSGLHRILLSQYLGLSDRFGIKEATRAGKCDAA